MHFKNLYFAYFMFLLDQVMELDIGQTHDIYCALQYISVAYNGFV